MNDQKKNLEDYRKMNEELEQLCKNGLKEENASWQKAINEFKEFYEKELKRRNQDNKILFDLLNNWLVKIQEFNNPKEIDKKRFGIFFNELII